MSYTINRTDGTVLTTLLDGTLNADTGITLIGRNYITYGEIQNENFVRLLENFSSVNPPGVSVGFTPLSGQLWWDSGNNRLKVYDGQQFVTVSERYVSAVAPLNGIKTGDQWWDITNRQLKVYSNPDWTVIGPGYTAGQGKSGAIVETITDTLGTNHTVVNTYTNGNLIAVSSFGDTFTPNIAGYTLFTNIRPGINLASNTVVQATATNSERLGGSFANTYARTDINPTFTKDIVVLGNLRFSSANIGFSSNILNISNLSTNGNIDIWTSTALGNIRALSVNGATGLTKVAGDPTDSLHIANKGYVDSADANLAADLSSVQSNLSNDINNLRYEYLSNLSIQVNSQNSNLSVTNGVVSALNTAFVANVALLNANIAAVNSHLSTVESYAVTLANTKANLSGPAFTGAPTTTNPQILIDQLRAWNTLTYYVNFNQQVTVNTNDYIEIRNPGDGAVLTNVSVNSTTTGTLTNVTVSLISGTITAGNTLITFVNNVYQAGTHIVSSGPSGPTPVYLGLGDNSTRIATTQYVDVTANLLYGDYNSRFNILRVDTGSYIQANTSIKANIDSPELRGYARLNVSPDNLVYVTNSRSPVSGNSSVRIATTQFVDQSIQSQKFNYTVSSNPPSGGNDGDFWFQID